MVQQEKYDKLGVVARATIQFSQKVPPHSEEAERAVLAGILGKSNNSSFAAKVCTLLSPEDFYISSNNHIFSAILALWKEKSPIDLVSVASQLHASGTLEKIGGAAALAEIAQSVLLATNSEYYLQIVLNKSKRRRLMMQCAEIITDGFALSIADQDFLLNSEKRLLDILTQETPNPFQHIRDAVEAPSLKTDTELDMVGGLPVALSVIRGTGALNLALRISIKRAQTSSVVIVSHNSAAVTRQLEKIEAHYAEMPIYMASFLSFGAVKHGLLLMKAPPAMLVVTSLETIAEIDNEGLKTLHTISAYFSIPVLAVSDSEVRLHSPYVSLDFLVPSSQ